MGLDYSYKLYFLRARLWNAAQPAAHLTLSVLSRALLLCGGLLLNARLASAQDPITLTFDRPQTAGISGFRAFWDTPVVLDEGGAWETKDSGQYGKAPSAVWSAAKRDNGAKPGALVFDAVHRSLLVRFPGAAGQIAGQIGKGYAVQKAELVLPFRDVEFWPEGYAHPSGVSFIGDKWIKDPPQWHAVVWALRKPWSADAKIGPTFNAAVNGSHYWSKFGAQDTAKDRFPRQFGPTEVSYKQTEGRVDVTSLLADASTGKTLAERLRVVQDQGFLVRKWELYDIRYKGARDSYEWGVATGGRGILIHTPKLVVTLLPTAQAPQLGEPTTSAALQPGDQNGRPTAVMPSAQQIKNLAARYGFHKPAWMPAWQWQRVQELQQAGGGWQFPDTPEAYAKWMDDLLAMAPRDWVAWATADKLQAYRMYADSWPTPVREHEQLFWTAWLMPDRETKDLVHPQGVHGANSGQYYERTGDWRGNTSFYRGGYTQDMSTMNFNHTASGGALIGGSIIGSQLAMQDGRHGLENFPLRTWSWFDGTTQESIDHYYFAITLKGQKVFADFGPTHLDRMMGQSILAKSVEELVSAYHPGLRHFISSSGRTGPGYLLATQDGTKHIIHTLSHSGALHDVGNKEAGMPVFGSDALPGTIAEQTLNGPWAPEWMANMVDEKPLPYESTASYKMWGTFAATPLWRKSYLGHHYGVASIDVSTHQETVPFMAQWRRADRQVQNVQDIGTLLGRYGANTTRLLNSNGGTVGTQGGHTVELQHKNKLLILASPFSKLEYPNVPTPENVKSLQLTLGLVNLQKQPGWEIFVDGQKVTAYPAKVKAGQRITIHDGVSYIGIVPLPSTDLGRSDEVVISDDGVEETLQQGGKARPSLLIQSYNYKSDTALDKATADWEKIDAAYNGFVVEMGDATEYQSFANFQQHMQSARLDTQWDGAAQTLNIVYKSGTDTMECGYKPRYEGNWDKAIPTTEVFPYRRVNGQWPYLPTGMERDTTLTQQSTSGRVEKNGATLTCEPGRMAYLQTEPISGTYAGFNPFPAPTNWSLSVPGGVMVKADGKLSLARVVVRPKENKLWVDYAARADQKGPQIARSLFVFGLKSAPQVVLNRQPLAAKPKLTKRDGQSAFVIPLSPPARPPSAARRRP